VLCEMRPANLTGLIDSSDQKVEVFADRNQLILDWGGVMTALRGA
jgi:hypothetical protein